MRKDVMIYMKAADSAGAYYKLVDEIHNVRGISVNDSGIVEVHDKDGELKATIPGNEYVVRLITNES